MLTRSLFSHCSSCPHAPLTIIFPAAPMDSFLSNTPTTLMGMGMVTVGVATALMVAVGAWQEEGLAG